MFLIGIEGGSVYSAPVYNALVSSKGGVEKGDEKRELLFASYLVSLMCLPLHYPTPYLAPMASSNPMPLGNDGLHPLLERRGRSRPQLLLARYVGIKL